MKIGKMTHGDSSHCPEVIAGMWKRCLGHDLDERKADEIKMGLEALQRLREAESFIGSEMTSMFGDDFDATSRRRWLESVRFILKANKIKPENLAGRWRTKGI